MLHHPQVVNIWVIWITQLGNQLQKHICIEDTEGVGGTHLESIPKKYLLFLGASHDLVDPR